MYGRKQRFEKKRSESRFAQRRLCNTRVFVLVNFCVPRRVITTCMISTVYDDDDDDDGYDDNDDDMCSRISHEKRDNRKR